MRGRSEEFQDINNAVCRWFCMAREALIPVSGLMIQEEAFQIALKLNVILIYSFQWMVGEVENQT